MKKDTLVCIIGESGSGKTTLVKLLKEKKNYNMIESYTTRLQRYKNEAGHIFVKENSIETKHMLDCVKNKPNDSDIIAYTYYNNNHYWSIKKQYQNKGISLYVIDPFGVSVLKKTVKDANLLFIYLNASESIREKRMKNRGDKIKDIKIRILNDKDNFKYIECDHVINANKNIDIIYNDAVEFIESKITKNN